MTTFTQVLINPGKYEGRKLLLNPQAMHARVLRFFPPDMESKKGERVLWRIDSQEHRHILYIVAPETPDTGGFVEQAGWETRPAQSADYQPLLDKLRVGQEWRFRLRANPAHRVASAVQGQRGKVLPHVTVTQQIAWLCAQGKKHGFLIPNFGTNDEIQDLQQVKEGIPTVAVTERGDRIFDHYNKNRLGKEQITLRQAQFDGALRIENVDLFRHALVSGIGRGKAYGCGLLTLAPVFSSDKNRE
ncbi:type I-E CRISPR-associated protein Cas6/Cse3/CasE [Schaalia sp. lx-100]|uniref:type I-E CRISPR-associated protein Cas6/Cse3/CasE n=1 Tax=Schaalia sp. lx-100 TaxID=2899081 RepID=UPI001E649AA8|nr:type I-E CRISPR-associated protein Cas6/Cse3/CasE [Schaalia sp. lx-100]MCD4556951.1 type I-E CRISPR-associated protein Cas6/Cse3/CasE [Schaalia sp. lx-100]